MGTLDSCINGMFEPGNIGASAGLTPDPDAESEPTTYTAQAVEFAEGTD